MTIIKIMKDEPNNYDVQKKGRKSLMSKNVSKITVNASANKVWDTLTKPELVKHWQYGSNLLTD